MELKLFGFQHYSKYILCCTEERKNDMMANNVRMLVFDLSITVMSELIVYSVKQMLLPVQAF